MHKSESIKELLGALSEFQQEVAPVKRNGKNDHFKSKYVELEDVIKVTRQPLKKHGLVLTQLPDSDGLVTILAHAATGEYISCSTPIVFEGQNPQKQKSAITYMRRTAMLSILGLEEQDDDGNEASQAQHQAKTVKATVVPGEFSCLACGSPAQKKQGEKTITNERGEKISKPWAGIFCLENKQHVQWIDLSKKTSSDEITIEDIPSF